MNITVQQNIASFKEQLHCELREKTAASLLQWLVWTDNWRIWHESWIYWQSANYRCLGAHVISIDLQYLSLCRFLFLASWLQTKLKCCCRSFEQKYLKHVTENFKSRRNNTYMYYCLLRLIYCIPAKIITILLLLKQTFKHTIMSCVVVKSFQLFCVYKTRHLKK